jgi:hypothetical protein
MKEGWLFVRLAVFILLTASRMNQNMGMGINVEYFRILKDAVVIY